MFRGLEPILYEWRIIGLAFVTGVLALVSAYSAIFANMLLYQVSIRGPYFLGLGLLETAMIVGLPALAVLGLLVAVRWSTSLPVQPLRSAGATLLGGLVGLGGLFSPLPFFWTFIVGFFVFPPAFGYAAVVLGSLRGRRTSPTSLGLAVHLAASSALYLTSALWFLRYNLRWAEPDRGCAEGCGPTETFSIALVLLTVYLILVITLLAKSTSFRKGRDLAPLE